MKYIRQFSTYLTLGVALLVGTANATPSSPLKDVTFERLALGVYVQGNKSGYLTIELIDNRRADPPTVLAQFEFFARTKFGDRLLEFRSRTAEVYDAVAPYRLLSSSEFTDQAGESASVEVHRIDAGPSYKALIKQGGRTREKTFKVEYTLSDLMASEFWLKRDPKVGDSLETLTFDMSTLSAKSSQLELKEKKKGRFDGVRTTYYVVEATDEDGLKYETLYLADGKPIRMKIAGLFEARLEPEAVAKTLAEPRDLFVDNLITVDGHIGPPSDVTRLELMVNAEFGKTLGPAPGQEVSSVAGTSDYRLVITSDNHQSLKPTPSELKAARETNLEFPVEDSEVIALAKTAVGNAQTDREKVENLVRFVDRYVEDSYSAEPLTVLDTIRTRRGDCTEHSALFTTLARASGLTARTVSGMVYVADDPSEPPSYGGHAWNEVVLDGYWVPVDATWGEVRTNATHIRFPIEGQGLSTLGTMAKARIRVLSVQSKSMKDSSH